MIYVKIVSVIAAYLFVLFVMARVVSFNNLDWGYEE